MELWMEWVALGTNLSIVIGGFIFGFIKLNNHQSRESGRTDKLEKDFEEHAKDELPHRNCAVHATKLDYLCTTVGEIKESIGTLDQRVYDKIRNGNKFEGLPLG